MLKRLMALIRQPWQETPEHREVLVRVEEQERRTDEIRRHVLQMRLETVRRKHG